MSTVIWDDLPECLLTNIYSKILFNQPINLLNDIISYKQTINYIINLFDYLSEWYILWFIILIYKKIKKNDIQISINNLNVTYRNALYWIKKYVINMTIFNKLFKRIVKLSFII